MIFYTIKYTMPYKNNTSIHGTNVIMIIIVIHFLSQILLLIYLLFQEDIRVFAASWNQHKIRSIKTSHSPSGRPHIMYNMPELYDCEDFLCDIDADEVDVCLDECSFDHLPCDEDVYNLANILMAEVNWIRDVDPFNNVNLYIFLRNAISQEL